MGTLLKDECIGKPLKGYMFSPAGCPREQNCYVWYDLISQFGFLINKYFEAQSSYTTL